MKPRMQTISVYLSKISSVYYLPTDVFVDSIAIYLDTEDLVGLRRVWTAITRVSLCMAHHSSQVCKFFYKLTEHPSIWKRLLNNITFPIPPLPPIAHYNRTNLSPLESERILVRATSLDKTWRKAYANVWNSWSSWSEFQINSLVLVPGGRYLVASTSDIAGHTHQIVVYVMDHRYETVPVAILPTPTKAYNLQAKYMYIKEAWPEGEVLTQQQCNELRRVPGITISYVYAKPQFRKDRLRRYATMQVYIVVPHRGSLRDLREHHDEFPTAEPPVAYIRECRCVHIALNELEYLGSDTIEPASKEYLIAARRQLSPFRPLVRLRTGSRFECLALCELDDSEYLVVVKGLNTIIFHELAHRGAHVELHCRNIVAQAEHKVGRHLFLPERQSDCTV